MNIISKHPIVYIRSVHGLDPTGVPVIMVAGLEDPILLFGEDRIKIVLRGDSYVRQTKALMDLEGRKVLALSGHTIEQAENQIIRFQTARATYAKALRDYYDHYAVLKTSRGLRVMASRYTAQVETRAEQAA